MLEDRTCVGIFVPEMTRKEVCSDTEFSSPPAGIEAETSSTIGQCANQ